MTRTRAAALALGALVAVGAGADLLASDLPLFCRLHGRWFLLPCVTRPAALSGEDIQSLRAAGAWVLAPPIPYGPASQHPGGRSEVLAAPSRAHWLGTDDRGRDVSARLVHGTRVALGVGGLAVLLAVLAGGAVGLLAARGRGFDLVFGRMIEVGLTFPALFLLLALRGLSGADSTREVVIAIALAEWPHLARLVRVEALRAAALPHVEAARALGASGARVALYHQLPEATPPLLVAAAFGVGQAVLLEAALTFLGFGVPPPAASWGELLAQAWASGLRLHLLLPPAVAIALTVGAFSLAGERLRLRGR